MRLGGSFTLSSGLPAMKDYYLQCISCNSVFDEVVFRCPKCGGLPIFKYTTGKFIIDKSKPGMWRYSNYLPRITNIVSRGEGLTPINEVEGVFIKNEKFNPTGTYSDRASSLIASYFLTNRVGKVITRFEEDFTYSLAYYLNGISEFEVVVEDVIALNTTEVSSILEMNGKLVMRVGSPTNYLEYANPLTVEGLKTIAFEIVERGVRADTIVVPARSGVLAYAIYKGLAELAEAGIDAPYEVVAALVRGEAVPNLLKVCRGMKFDEVYEEEILNAIIRLSKRGIRTKPLSALAYATASNTSSAVAVVTMGFKAIPIHRSKNDSVRREVCRIVREAGRATAYEIWRKAPIYTLRGIYKLLNSMERRKEICSEVVYRGNRKVRYYRMCE
ncbi:MAG: pyridoxal-phosphate dependent enzyme [Sulfolobales archaeon]